MAMEHIARAILAYLDTQEQTEECNPQEIVIMVIIIASRIVPAAPIATAMRIGLHTVRDIKRKLPKLAAVILVILQHHIAAHPGIMAVLQQELADARNARPAAPAMRVPLNKLIAMLRRSTALIPREIGNLQRPVIIRRSY
jgi:hypothetical protein